MQIFKGLLWAVEAQILGSFLIGNMEDFTSFNPVGIGDLFLHLPEAGFSHPPSQ